MLGGMLTMFLMETMKLPLWAAVPLAVLLATLVGLVFERLAIRRYARHHPSVW